MGVYRVDNHIYTDITDAVADYFEAVSQNLSETVASKLGSVVLERSNPIDGDRVFVYKYSTKFQFNGFDKTNDDLVATSIVSEILQILNAYPIGTQIRPMRLVFCVPPVPSKPNNLYVLDELPLVAQIVWIVPEKE